MKGRLGGQSQRRRCDNDAEVRVTSGHKARYVGSFLELEKERDLLPDHDSANSFWISDLQNTKLRNLGHFKSLDLQQCVMAAIGN